MVYIRIYSGCCHQLQSTSRIEATCRSFTAKSRISQYWLPVDSKPTVNLPRQAHERKNMGRPSAKAEGKEASLFIHPCWVRCDGPGQGDKYLCMAVLPAWLCCPNGRDRPLVLERLHSACGCSFSSAIRFPRTQSQLEIGRLLDICFPAS